jgi:glyoxylase-like metal-dependent hydrolase (beta-lactamase superfamily II)
VAASILFPHPSPAPRSSSRAAGWTPSSKAAGFHRVVSTPRWASKATTLSSEAISTASARARPFFAELVSAPPALPNLTFDRRLTLHCGDVDVEVLHLGRGHTAGDAVVWIPRESVVVTGDLVHGIDPLFFEAFPDEWPVTLGRLAELDFRILIPGHGPVQRGKRTLRSLKAYLTELNEHVRAGIAAGKSLEALRTELAPARMRSLQANGYLETIKRNRKDLLGLTDDPATAYGLDDVYRYFTRESHVTPGF